MLTYAITVANEGNTVLNGLAVRDTLNGTDIDLSKATLSGSETATLAEGKLSGVGIGETVTITYSYTVKATDTALKNVAIVGDKTETTAETEVTPKETYSANKALSLVNGAAYHSGAKVAVGDELTYAITVANEGNTVLNDLSVSDKMNDSPIDLSKATLSGSETATLAEGKLSGVGIGETVTITYTYTVKAADTALTNVALVGDKPDDARQTETTVEEAPAYSASKALSLVNGAAYHSGDKVAVGDELTYAITVANEGNTVLNDLSVSDKMNDTPIDLSGATLDKPEGSRATLAEGKLNGVGIGETVTLSYSYKVKATDAALKNVAMVGGRTETTAETEVTPKEAYSASKALSLVNGAAYHSGDKVAVGDELTYAITVVNEGNTVLNGLAVIDKMNDSPIDLSRATLSGSETATFAEGKLNGVGIGETVTLSYSYTVKATDATLTNAATVGEQTSTTTLGVDNPSIGISKTITNAPANGAGYEPGETIRYNVVVINNGNLELHGIQVTDPLTGMDEAIDRLPPGASVTLHTNHVVTEADLLGANGYASSVTELELDDAGGINTQPDSEPTKKLTNTAAVEGATSNNATVSATSSAEAPIADVTTGVSVVGVVKLKGAQISKATEVPVGATIAYEITVTNNGNVTTKQTIRDVFILNGDAATKKELTLTSEGVSYDKFKAFTIPPKQSKVFTASYTVQATDKTLFNLASVAGRESSVTTNVADHPALTVEKVADGTGLVRLKDKITYAITVKNSGNVTVSGITVTDPKTGLNETIESLAPGEEQEYATTYEVTEDDILAGRIENEATAAGTGPNGESVTGRDTETVTNASGEPVPDNPGKPVIDAPRAELTVEEVANGAGLVGLKDKITYTITVTNSGNVSVYNITVTDNKTGLNEVIASLAPGEKRAYTMIYEVTEADILRGRIMDTATAAGTDPNGDPVTGTDTVTLDNAPSTTDPDQLVIDGQKSELTVAEKVTSTPANGKAYALNENIAFSITVKNTGNVTLSNVTVTDSLTGLNKAIASLAPDAEQSFSTTYSVTEADILAGAIENTATGRGTAPNGTTTADAVSVPVTAIAPKNGHLTISKKTTSAPANGGTYALGETIRYSIATTNDGNLTLTNVVVSDPLTGLTHHVGAMDPGASATVTTNYAVTAADVAAGSVTNTATVTGNDPNGSPVTQSSSAVAATALPRVTLTVNYWYDAVGGAIAAPTFNAAYFVGTAYNVASPIVSGHNASRETVAGTITRNETFDVIYSPVPYTLTINYVYEDGTVAAAAYTDTLTIGDSYTVTSPTIEGYTASDAVVAGTMPGRNVTITVIYLSEATIVPIDKRGISLNIGDMTMNVGDCFE